MVTKQFRHNYALKLTNLKSLVSIAKINTCICIPVASKNICPLQVITFIALNFTEADSKVQLHPVRDPNFY